MRPTRWVIITMYYDDVRRFRALDSNGLYWIVMAGCTLYAPKKHRPRGFSISLGLFYFASRSWDSICKDRPDLGMAVEPFPLMISEANGNILGGDSDHNSIARLSKNPFWKRRSFHWPSEKRGWWSRSAVLCHHPLMIIVALILGHVRSCLN